MRTPGSIHIGTSGWMYKDWGEAFYPKKLSESHLSYLAREFDTVEVNSSFYHLPKKHTFMKWEGETPEQFVFAVKLSRYITHEKRLRGIRSALERFVRHAAPLRQKLGVILVQLPPWQRYEERVLRSFLKDVEIVTARNYPLRFALELRHASWMEANAREVRSALSEANMGLVFSHSSRIPSFSPEAENLTSDFVYIRFHGPGEFGASHYGARRLRVWTERIREWREGGREVFAYFNNDAHGHAVDDARTLIRGVRRLCRDGVTTQGKRY